MPDGELRCAIFNVVTPEDLAESVNQVDSLVRPPEDVYYRELAASYRRVRRFLPALIRTVRFGSTPAGETVIEALNYLMEVEEQGRTKAGDPPLGVVTKGWRRYVSAGDSFDHNAYVFCCLDRLRSALRRRDIFIAPSVRYADARTGLLTGSSWDAARSTVCRSLGHSPSAEETLRILTRQLDQTYRAVAANLPTNAGARVEKVDGVDELIVTAIDKIDEPARPGEVVEARVSAASVAIFQQSRRIAIHERCYGHQQDVLDLDHYLEVLERKPGALTGSKPLAAWREKGLWPRSYDELLERLVQRHGKQSGIRHMVQVIRLIREHGHHRVRQSIETALSVGCSDVAAIQHLVCSANLAHAQAGSIELGALARYDRPLPVMVDYDCLLRQEAAR